MIAGALVALKAWGAVLGLLTIGLVWWTIGSAAAGWYPDELPTAFVLMAILVVVPAIGAAVALTARLGKA